MGVVMVKKRDKWSSKMQFVLTCVGYAVGLGAFFIPYTICAIVIGFPVMFFEMSIGQFHQVAANRLFPKYVSIFRGLGWCMAILNTIVGITYNTVIGWCLMYTFYSIFFPMSIWMDCSNDWNDACCSTNVSSIPSDCLFNISETPSKQFFFNKILEKSHSISDFNSFNWRMAIAILISAMGCALINVAGTKSMGKTAYVTATVPYFLIVALLGNSLFIPGGLEGIVSSLQPDFNHLTRIDTWYKAGGQVSYSLSLGVANLISFSSCNSKNYNCYSDCFLVSMADFGMSLLGSLTIFSVMGILAFKNNGTVLAEPIAQEMPLAKTAEIWKFFRVVTVDGETKRQCLKCNNLLPVPKDTSTSHLINHLKSKGHEEQFKEYESNASYKIPPITSFFSVQQGKEYLQGKMDEELVRIIYRIITLQCTSSTTQTNRLAQRKHIQISRFTVDGITAKW